MSMTGIVVMRTAVATIVPVTGRHRIDGGRIIRRIAAMCSARTRLGADLYRDYSVIKFSILVRHPVFEGFDTGEVAVRLVSQGAVGIFGDRAVDGLRRLVDFHDQVLQIEIVVENVDDDARSRGRRRRIGESDRGWRIEIDMPERNGIAVQHVPSALQERHVFCNLNWDARLENLAGRAIGKILLEQHDLPAIVRGVNP